MQQRLLACVQIASKLGFEQASQSCLPRKLSQIDPNGGTHMRDSIMLGTELMLKFRMATEELGLGEVWNFIHLVITDGSDGGSRTSLRDLGGALYGLQQLLPKGFLKTIYIGVDIENDRKALEELAALRILGGDQADIFSVNDRQIDEIFERIQISLGILTRRQGVVVQTNQGTYGVVREQNQAVIQVQRQRYMVLFNIDRSGSMSGQKWRNVCRAVNSFLTQLGDEDLVCGLVFNTDVEIVTFMNTNRQIAPPSPPPPRRTQAPAQVVTRQQAQPQYDPQPAQANYERLDEKSSKNSDNCKKFAIIILSLIVIALILVFILK